MLRTVVVVGMVLGIGGCSDHGRQGPIDAAASIDAAPDADPNPNIACHTPADCHDAANPMCCITAHANGIVDSAVCTGVPCPDFRIPTCDVNAAMPCATGVCTFFHLGMGLAQPWWVCVCNGALCPP